MHINSPFARTALADAVAVTPVDDTLAEQVRQELDDAWRKSVEKLEDSFFWGPDGKPEGTAYKMTESTLTLSELERYALDCRYILEDPDPDRLHRRAMWMAAQYRSIYKDDYGPSSLTLCP